MNNNVYNRIMFVAVLSLFVMNNAHAQRVVAIPGQPYGVAHVSLPLPASASGDFADANAFSISDAQGRVFYPVFNAGNFGEIAGEIANEFIGGNPFPIGNRLQLSFLFVGAEPFQVTVLTPEPQTLLVQPDLRRARLHTIHLKRWWRNYHAQTRRQIDQGDYPPLIETYLAEMLSGRLGLAPPLLTQRREAAKSQLQQTTQLLFGAEELRLATLRDTMRGAGGIGEPATIPVPPPIEWIPLEFPEGEEPAQPPNVEKIAMHIPKECYFIRFGSFENYLWLDHLKDDYGGNIGRMTTLRGHNAKLEQKFQNQLGLKQSAASELLGPNFISDVALLGTDLYLKEGAAMGVLFESKNNFALSASFNADRAKGVQEFKAQGAKLETIEIAGKKVSFLSTPDNQLRSFYVVDGNYHLVTTSKNLVKRFLEAGQGTGALGSSVEFQHARSVLPLEREDTVFAYFSSAFFRNLLSPQYQVELSRRLQSVTNMELLQLATLAAKGEQQPHQSVEELVRGGFLPSTFLRFPLDQQPQLTDAGYIDPLRGKRGFYTPIPDVELTTITNSEAQLYDRCARYCEANWSQMDPLMVGVKRYALEEGERMERITVDANVSPLVEGKYGWLLSMVGPPTDVDLLTNPNDVVKLQMSLKGGLLWPAIEPHHLLMGIQDTPVGEDIVPSGFLQTLKLMRTTPGFIGAWPQLGLLDLVPGLTWPPDANGMSPLPFGIWRWQGRGFSNVSFNPDVLLNEGQFLEAIPSENAAQFRLRVGDLTQSQLSHYVTMLNYSRARDASLGNVRLLNAMSQQMRVPPEESLDIANKLLDTELVCTLSGDYEFANSMWRSTAWPQRGQLPPAYQAPLLEWFRGLTADFSKDSTSMQLHAEIDMLRKEREKPKAKLPTFNFFGGNKE